ncbi:unnamed protein product, partial [marine sediment metagenome]
MVDTSGPQGHIAAGAQEDHGRGIVGAAVGDVAPGQLLFAGIVTAAQPQAAAKRVPPVILPVDAVYPDKFQQFINQRFDFRGVAVDTRALPG